MLQGIVSGAIWFFAFLGFHILWFHKAYVERRALLIMATFASSLAGNFGTLIAVNAGALSVDRITLRIIYGSLVMACLFVLYMPFFYTIATSLSVQTLICLHDSPKRELSLSALQHRFASLEIVTGRLDVMAMNGYLTRLGDRYTTTLKGRTIAGFFGYLKEIWKLGPGG